MIEVSRTKLAGVLILQPEVFNDRRGFHLEEYSEKFYGDLGITDKFIQLNHSLSIPKVVRGLHGQRKNPQAKLIRCLVGEILDVVVDIRPKSDTFGQWISEVISGHKQIYIPPGFLHGFCVLGNVAAEVQYQCSQPYDPKDEIGVRWNDKRLAITWPVFNPVLSKKDEALPKFNEVFK